MHRMKPTARPQTTAPAVRAGTASGGQALDRHTQATMSARFGHDFSSVRVHTDSRAGDSAASFGANAFALGSDIVFGAGKYTPGSPSTERLLAHELTHVAQQSQFGPGDWGRASHEGDASEREADTLASQVVAGRSVEVRSGPGAALARDDAQNSWLGDVYGLGQTGGTGGGASASPSGPSTARNSWLGDTFGVNAAASSSGGGAAPSQSGPTAAQNSWLGSSMGIGTGQSGSSGSNTGGSSGGSSAQSSFLASALGMDASSY